MPREPRVRRDEGRARRRPPLARRRRLQRRGRRGRRRGYRRARPRRPRKTRGAPDGRRASEELGVLRLPHQARARELGELGARRAQARDGRGVATREHLFPAVAGQQRRRGDGSSAPRRVSAGAERSGFGSLEAPDSRCARGPVGVGSRRASAGFGTVPEPAEVQARHSARGGAGTVLRRDVRIPKGFLDDARLFFFAAAPREDAAHAVVRRLSRLWSAGVFKTRLLEKELGERRLRLFALLHARAPRVRAALAPLGGGVLGDDHEDVPDAARHGASGVQRTDVAAVLDPAEQTPDVAADLRRVETYKPARERARREMTDFMMLNRSSCVVVLARSSGRALRARRARWNLTGLVLELFAFLALILVSLLALRLASLLLQPLFLGSSLLLLTAHPGLPLLLAALPELR